METKEYNHRYYEEHRNSISLRRSQRRKSKGINWWKKYRRKNVATDKQALTFPISVPKIQVQPLPPIDWDKLNRIVTQRYGYHDKPQSPNVIL